MMPNIELRLATMRRALTEIILPAIAPGNALAREQAQLLIAHLDLMEGQLADATAIDAEILRGTQGLARDLIACAAGGTDTQAALSDLRLALDDQDTTTTTARRARVAAAIDRLLEALHRDGDESCGPVVHELIVAHALRDGLIERVSFASNGLDPERAALPSLADLLASRRNAPSSLTSTTRHARRRPAPCCRS